MDFPPIHAFVATFTIAFNIFLLWKMTKKFLDQRDICDRLDEVRLRYQFMLNELATLLDEERQQFIDLNKREDSR